MAASDYFEDLSLILSQLMDDIGVNEECILITRKKGILLEHINSLDMQLVKRDVKHFYFGSKTEGTTTPGLNSDSDGLYTYENINIIQDDNVMALGKQNILMTETEFPGYCNLQCLRFDETNRECYPIIDRGKVYDEQGNIFLKNDFSTTNNINIRQKRKRPAFTRRNQFGEADAVFALRCTTWPNSYKRMSSSQRSMSWPTPEMIRYIETSGCFVVRTGHRLSEEPELEWRISTSLAERCLMFSLNITQLRCYILLKMILKTFIEPKVPDVISSYISKTLLFHCIEKTDIDFWKERNLLKCVSRVLLFMLAAVHSMNCPNYFNKSANLLLGKIDVVTQNKLLHIIRHMLKSKGGFLLEIHLDSLNIRLTEYITDRCFMLSKDANEIIRNTCFIRNHLSLLRSVYTFEAFDDNKNTALEDLNRVLLIMINYARKGSIQSEVSTIVFPFKCSLLAYVQANESILRGTDLTPITLLLLKHGLKSDVTSSRLKYASYLYCTGQFQRTLTVLEDVEQRITERVIPQCLCYVQRKIASKYVKPERHRGFSTKNFALCVTFRQAEIQCCPRELRFEMFRSTEEDMPYLQQHDWIMDKAAIDPLPYIYFLQFMVYRHLGKDSLKDTSLWKLALCTFDFSILSHSETAYNLLGQCMEHEMLYEAALLCYVNSLLLCKRNNAAKWHLGRLLSSLINDKKK